MAKHLVSTGLARTPSGRPARRLMFNDATGMMEYQYAGLGCYGPKDRRFRTWVTWAKVDHALWMVEDIDKSHAKLNGRVEF
jgi:hypothetical protein